MMAWRRSRILRIIPMQVILLLASFPVQGKYRWQTKRTRMGGQIGDIQVQPRAGGAASD